MNVIDKFVKTLEERVNNFGKRLAPVAVSNHKTGFTFFEALTLLFAAARLFGFTDWNWLLVFSPLILKTAAITVFTIIGGTVIVFVSVSELILDLINNYCKSKKAAKSIGHAASGVGIVAKI